MAYCTDCGSSLKDEALHCPSCGARQLQSRAVMPALDIYEERPISVYNRMESFPPLFETEQPKKRTKTEPVTGFVKTAPKPKTGKLRKGLLAAALAVIIVFGAVAGDGVFGGGCRCCGADHAYEQA